jgi:hypothetical protein
MSRWECARCGHGKGQMHDLKIWPHFFSDVLNGTKTFELRRNDRNFECGDDLLLREWNPETREYTGREIIKHVAMIVTQSEGLAEGWVILGLLPA